MLGADFQSGVFNFDGEATVLSTFDDDNNSL